MERLTERDEFGNANIVEVDSAEFQLSLDFDDFNRVTNALNKLAEYEDLEEQGKLLKLPCAVGDMVYRIIKGFHTGRKKIISGKVYRIALTDTEIQIFIDKWQSKGIFGKTVFLTKSEAEQKLREMEG